MNETAGRARCCRVIDANLNRAREGLRVLEDSMRLFHGNVFFLRGHGDCAIALTGCSGRCGRG